MAKIRTKRADGDLLGALDAGEPGARAEAARAIEALGPEGPDAAALAAVFAQKTFRYLGARRGARDEALSREDEELRAPLARALQARGLAARAALPALLLSIGQSAPQVSDAAIFAVEAIAPREAAELLLGRLRDTSGEARRTAARSLRELVFTLRARAAYARRVREPRAMPRVIEALEAEGMPVLLEALRGPDEFVSHQMLSVLGELEPGRPEALAALLAALDDRRPALARAAAVSLGGWGPAAAPAVPLLTRLLQGALDHSAAFALGQIGAPARTALPQLERNLQVRDPSGQEAARQAISMILAAEPEPEPSPRPPRKAPPARSAPAKRKAPPAPPKKTKKKAKARPPPPGKAKTRPARTTNEARKSEASGRRVR